MAAPKSKRSIRKKQSTKQSAKPHRNHQSEITNQKSTHFPEAAGKILEDVEFATSADHDVISLSFSDNTAWTSSSTPALQWRPSILTAATATIAYSKTGRLSTVRGGDNGNS